MTAKLFTPLPAGALHLRNRVVMAPLTRNRATPDGNVPGSMAPDYYGQRAGFGLIISEGTQISPSGQGYAWTPGMHSEGWRPVTEAVARPGRYDRRADLACGAGVAHRVPARRPGARRAVGATGPQQDLRRARVRRHLGAARTGERGDSRGRRRLREAARNAREAGFDGVEIHGANGYLIDQFMRPSANERTDGYGGSVENRTRFLVEVVEAVAAAIGAERVGLRLSPFSPANGVVVDETASEIFARVIERIDPVGLAYLHMVEGATGGSRELPKGASIEALRALFSGVYIANNGYDREMAIEAVESGRADAAAFGKLAIANPDLAERLRLGAPLNAPDRDTFYGGGAEGYVDYPRLQPAAA